MTAERPRPADAEREHAYYLGFAAGWRDRATFDERAGRLDAVAEAAAWIDGLAEGIRIGQAAAGGTDDDRPAAKSWVTG
ncbi:MAG TPA: hypothetical protein VGJ44_22380 [Kribbellaceae bacterium]|jgi:hypothetical protein